MYTKEKAKREQQVEIERLRRENEELERRGGISENEVSN